MLTANNDSIANHDIVSEIPPETAPENAQSPLVKMLRLEWIGQTVASLCWIVSVFSYGISETGDWLQLGAASAWLLANIAAAMTPEDG